MEYRIGEARLRPQQRSLLVGGKDSRIGARAFDLLLALVENRDRTVTKNELLDRVWPGVVVEENNLQVHISSLRKLLGPRAIATVPGRGYRFTAMLEGGGPLSPAVDAAAVAPTADSTTGPGDSTPNNLPAELPQLFGRADDLAALRALIATHKLVTVVGAGGIGKTAMAQALAQQLRGAMSDGVWLVELAPLAHASLVVATVAGVLGIRLAGEAPIDTLVSALGNSRMLVVLDNCEGLLDGIAELAAALYRGAPNVRLVATSQEPLHLRHEQVYRLGPLAVPEAAAVDLARHAGAIALFAARARAVQPQFALGEDNVGAVVDICRQLDGIALAIELAAARLPLLGVDGLRARLGERFKVLTGGSRLALRRHQTLRAALDWSHGLLSAPEQAVFRRLGIFTGGFSLEAVQALAGDDAELDAWSVLDHLGALVDKSLVVAEGGATPRYRLLETTRAYALEQLASAGETQATVERHAKVMRDIFERADSDCYGEQGSMDTDALVARLWPEFDNLRAALAWAIAEQSQTPTAVALAAAAAPVFRLLGQGPEGLAPLLALRDRLDDSLDPPLRARFWFALAHVGGEGRLPLQAVLDAFENAERIYRQHLAPRRLYCALCSRAWNLAIGNRLAEAEALLPQIVELEQASWPGSLRGWRLNLQHLLLNMRDQFTEALAVLEDWHSLHPPTGDEFGRLTLISNRCNMHMKLQRFDEAASLAHASIERYRHDRLHGRSMGYLFAFLMKSLTATGQLEQAHAALRAGVPYWLRDGCVLSFCEDVALLLAKLHRHDDAARLAGASAAKLQRYGVTAGPCVRQPLDELMQHLATAQVPRDDVARLMREGSQLDMDAVAALYIDTSAAR